ncbi:hypothetical protein [Agromyces aerolatus]|uniref:hypothetical protein n=1 Tax=Agromyces sp. LY-1074 TaxID=3074080 RepID=UPI002864F768|nr:hypothetical protein [Agromyces sp. LY-1074]MDR5706770.1 hypothetical protein [Agromyces sp. LY-1358]
MAAATLTLVGCSPPSPGGRPTETVRQSAFSSLDEVFEAAVAAYQDYIDLWNQIAAEGGADPERIASVMESEEAAAEDIAVFEGLVAEGVRISGPIAFHNPRLVHYRDGVPQIQVNACFDRSRARLVDREGNDVTSPTREERIPLKITFAITESGSVVVSRSQEWKRPGIC